MIQGRFGAWGWLVRDEKESDSYLLRLLRSGAWGWLAPPQAATFGRSLRWRRPDPGHRGALDSGGGRIQASSAFHPKQLLSTPVLSPAHAPAPALGPTASMAGAVEEQGPARRCCGEGMGARWPDAATRGGGRRWRLRKGVGSRADRRESGEAERGSWAHLSARGGAPWFCRQNARGQNLRWRRCPYAFFRVMYTYMVPLTLQRHARRHECVPF
jgi:hypothetical protein